MYISSKKINQYIVKIKSKVFPEIEHLAIIDLHCWERINWSSFERELKEKKGKEQISLQCEENLDWAKLKEWLGTERRL